MPESDSEYQMFQMLNKEMSFDVDLSTRRWLFSAVLNSFKEGDDDEGGGDEEGEKRRRRARWPLSGVVWRSRG